MGLPVLLGLEERPGVEMDIGVWVEGDAGVDVELVETEIVVVFIMVEVEVDMVDEDGELRGLLPGSSVECGIVAAELAVEG